MKFGTKTLLVTLVAVLLAAPTGATAAPGKKGGHGGGPPSWAGQGNGGGQGKPSWAGQGHGKPDKADKGKAAHEKADNAKAKGKKAEAEELDLDGGETDGNEFSFEQLEGLNPAHYCFGLAEELGESFSEMFGTNPNLANAHGKCVSRRAHGEDLTDGLKEEEAGAEAEACPPAEEGTEEDTAGDDELVAAEEGEPEGEETSADECETEELADEESADEEGDEESQGEGDEAEDEEFSFEQLEGLNPAHYCVALAAELDDNFADMFGTNSNQANAHGMCVSSRAQELGEDEEAEGEEPAEEELADDEEELADEEESDESEGEEPEGEEADGDEGEDETFTFTVTVEVDVSFLGL